MQQSELINKLNTLNEEFKKINDKKNRDSLDSNQLDMLNSMISDLTSKINMMNIIPVRPSQDEIQTKSTANYDLETSYFSGIGLEGMSTLVSSYLAQNSIIRKNANVMKVNSDSLEFVKSTNDINAEWSTGSTAPNSIEGYEKIKIPLFDLMAQPKVTQRLLDDTSIDFTRWFASEIGQIFLEAENSAFINGNGVNKPKGILSYGGIGQDKIEEIKTNDANKITVDGLINLIYSLNDSYSNNAMLLMNKMTVQEVRKLKDSNGQYLWMPGILSGKSDTLMGIPLSTVSYLPSVAAGNYCAIYGNLAKAYTIADYENINIQIDPYTSKPFVSFYATKRVGGDLTNAKALKLLKVSA